MWAKIIDGFTTPARGAEHAFQEIEKIVSLVIK